MKTIAYTVLHPDTENETRIELVELHSMAEMRYVVRRVLRIHPGATTHSAEERTMGPGAIVIGHHRWDTLTEAWRCYVNEVQGQSPS